MSKDQHFKDTLRRILSEAVDQHRDELLAAFAPLVNNATDARLAAMDFRRGADSAVREVFNSTLSKHLMAHATEAVDRLIAERLTSPDTRALIFDQVSAWLSGKDFDRLIADRTGLLLRAILADVLEREYRVSADAYNIDDGDPSDYD